MDRWTRVRGGGAAFRGILKLKTIVPSSNRTTEWGYPGNPPTNGDSLWFAALYHSSGCLTIRRILPSPTNTTPAPFSCPTYALVLKMVTTRAFFEILSPSDFS